MSINVHQINLVKIWYACAINKFDQIYKKLKMSQSSVLNNLSSEESERLEVVTEVKAVLRRREGI